MTPKELLQLIHSRGEQAAVPAAIHDQAREAAKQLYAWIEERMTYTPPAKAFVSNEDIPQ